MVGTTIVRPPIDKFMIAFSIGIIVFGFWIFVYHPDQTVIIGPSSHPQIQCNQNEVLEGDVCILPHDKDSELSNTGVIEMRVNRIVSIINEFNSSLDTAQEGFLQPLYEIKKDTENESSIDAYNKTYLFRQHFDGVGSDELISDPVKAKMIYYNLTDLLLSQYKAFSLSSELPDLNDTGIVVQEQQSSESPVNPEKIND